MFKIAAHNNPMSGNKNKGTGEQGKDITMYAGYNVKGCDFWIDIMGRIPTELARARIPPGYRTTRTTDPSPGGTPDKGILGTEYVSYRYENEPPADFFGQRLAINPLNVQAPKPPATIYHPEAASQAKKGHVAASPTIGGGYK